ncbi:MAG: TetR/AcrR family transcriptional regulator [Elusimicrobiales bacterium]
MPQTMPAATRKGENTKARLTAACAREIRARGFCNVSVSDFAARAELAVGGFYRYYKSKEDVLAEMADVLSRDLEGRLAALDGAAVPELLRAFCAFALKNRCMYQALREAEFYCPPAAAVFNGRWRRAVARAVAGTRRPELALEIVCGAQYFWAMRYPVWQGKPAPEDKLAVSAAIISGGLAAKKVLALEEMAAAASRWTAHKPAAKPQDARGKLLQSAQEQFGKRGFYSAPVAEISRRAGLSVGYFYRCFGSKEDAFRQTTVNLRRTLTGYTASACSGAQSRLETELRSLSAFFEFIRRNPQGYRILREAEFVDRALAEDYYLGLMRDYAASMRLTAAGEFATEDYEAAAFTLMGAGHALGLKYGGVKPPLAEIAGALFNGILGE